jgi:hypothetical protein
MALAPTQPPIQWVPGALSLAVKRPGREADHSPPSSAELKEWVELYLHSPNMPSWRGAQLKEAQGQLYLYLYLILTSLQRYITSDIGTVSFNNFPVNKTRKNSPEQVL